MFIVSEEHARDLMTEAAGFDAVESVFAAMSRGDAYNFPVIREAIGHADALYGFKSGFDRAGLVLGLKSGGYWPGNLGRGLTNHQSTVFLFDPDTGRPTAMVGGNYLTAIRTAAASSVSIKYLARPESRVLGIVGAGHQSHFQIRAAVAQRQFERVVAWNLHPEMLDGLERTVRELGLMFVRADRPDLCEVADVIITITSSHDPLLMADWVRPGTHLACMGTDTAGKMEVDKHLVAKATVFTDEVAQSVTIGEGQHAICDGLMSEEAITPIGDVINGVHGGRRSADEITLFDGTGVGLQDLAVADAVVKIAEEKGVGQRIDL
ncbi:MAG: ornithine cyclodeaminase family protein [Alphaproteobacteria bacterium]|nr:ornithine cyclodeaminase family protein [Alphaproteobacteria bacterium]